MESFANVFMTFALNCIVYHISTAFLIDQLLDNTVLTLGVANEDTAQTGMRLSSFVNGWFNMPYAVGIPMLR